MMNTNELIQQAIEAGQRGDRAAAKQLLSNVVKQDPRNARAWYLLSQVEDVDHQAIYCLQRVLELQPDNKQVRARLQRLQEKLPPPIQAASPESIPVAIPSVGTSPKAGTKLPTKQMVNALIGFLSMCVVCVCLYAVFFTGTQDGDPTPTPRIEQSQPIRPKATSQRNIQPANAVCSCTGDIYNCDDFPSHRAAQACFDYCLNQGRGDIHRLDRENDGRACE